MSEELIVHYLCIGCPLGCRLEVEVDAVGDVVEVRNSICKTGKEYGRQEHLDPRRMVTTTVRVRGGRWEKLPVKTTGAVPKHKVHEVCAALRGAIVEAPAAMGAVVAENVAGTGVDVIATRDMPAQEKTTLKKRMPPPTSA